MKEGASFMYSKYFIWFMTLGIFLPLAGIFAKGSFMISK